MIAPEVGSITHAILEAEATIAIRSVGIEPRLGILHVDVKRRESFACDLMEAVRPQVDAYVLDLLYTRTFLRSDFFEMTDGCGRLMPTLTKPLAATAPRWAKLLAPFAERAAGLFAGSGPQTSIALAADRWTRACDSELLPYCKRIRRGSQMPKRTHWGERPVEVWSCHRRNGCCSVDR